MPTRPTTDQSPPRTSGETRRAFLDFFREKGHTIVPSAPLVPQDDPTLLFINAGMNPFKDVFLGTGSRPYSRVADTQKCLRVSGKHNDLEEVGLDTYHHTFFEMLGNWSFGDYFKREAIAWAWELLVDRWGLDPDRLYATVHEGDEGLGLDADAEAAGLWKSETSIPHDHVLFQGSKDNFWMMGDTGPCGPCSEIHYDLRPDAERAEVDGKALVNAGHPQVIEIWNLVFIQYNASVKGEGETVLAPLPKKHVDTGMGFERLCAVLQGKTSNYDIDLFQDLLAAIAEAAPDAATYEAADERQRIAMRVVADHLRTLAFAIADGAQPGNTGRGYVIRRILRRAVRYGYQALGFRAPFLFGLVPVLGEVMGEAFPEIVTQQDYIQRVIRAEEEGFLRTLGTGIEMFEIVVPIVKNASEVLRRTGSVDEAIGALQADERSSSAADKWFSLRHLPQFVSDLDPYRLRGQVPEDVKAIASVMRPIVANKSAEDLISQAYGDITTLELFSRFGRSAIEGQIPGEIAFLLHDTYGFPSDLTALMARERGLSVDMARFDELMQEQKDRARAAGAFKVDQSQVDAWDPTPTPSGSSTSEAQTHEGRPIEFVGYDALTVEGARILKTRTVGEGAEARYELVLNRTPFYAESGGQVGDTGRLGVGGEEIAVLDTVKDAEGTIIHVVDRLPENPEAEVSGAVDAERRQRIMRHHSATHLLHAALREVLGPHVQQKGSLVAPERLRFDFAHYERVSDDEQRRIERRVNEVVLRNLPLGEERSVPIEEAKARGAMALFGEKYGERVRVITFSDGDPGSSPGEAFDSVELCGGTHVPATGAVGLFKLTSEGSVASGVRRIEAVAGSDALEWLDARLGELDAARGHFKQLPAGLDAAVESLLEQNKALEKELAEVRRAQAAAGLDTYLNNAQDVDGVRLVTAEVEGADMDALRDLAEQARDRLSENGVAVFGSANATEGKAYLAASVTDDLVKKGVQAGKLVGALAKRVGGGGGGRPQLATAGGRQPEKLAEALGAAADALRALRG